MPRELTRSDGYADQVRKLIPAEVSAAFLAINSQIELDDRLAKWVVLFFFILVPICWLYLKKFQYVESKLHLFFTSCIAFPVWASSMAIDRIDFFVDLRFLPGAALIVVTLVAPLLVRETGDGG